jgi:hypothetical protein
MKKTKTWRWELVHLRITKVLFKIPETQFRIYKAVPGAHDSPIRCTSAMNFGLETGWQAEAAPAVAPGVGAWSSGE